MKHLELFIKGIVAGIGGVAPGLSGSVILISLGLYTRTIDAISGFFKDVKNNTIFLGPILSGMLISAVFFSRVIDDSLRAFEIQTRLLFLGMCIGTVPLFFDEVRREEKLKRQHYAIMVPFFLLGLAIMFVGDRSSSDELISVPVAFVLGFLGVALTIIPGLNWGVVFSAMGIYNHWLTLMSFRPEDFSLSVYIPALIGAGLALVAFSKLFTYLLHHVYTATLAALFGFYMAVIPSIVLDSSEGLLSSAAGAPLYIGIALFFVGFFIALVFGRMSKRNNADSTDG